MEAKCGFQFLPQSSTDLTVVSRIPLVVGRLALLLRFVLSEALDSGTVSEFLHLSFDRP